MSELYFSSSSISQNLHFFSYRCISAIDHTLSSTFNSQHQTRQQRKRRQTSNPDNENETFENNASENNHESSVANNRPLIDVTNSISTSRQIKRKRRC